MESPTPGATPKSRVVIGAAVLAVLGVAAASSWYVYEKASAPPYNVVVVLVDTLRADHLGSYGYHRATSPNIDAFFHDGVVFRGARSQASCTYPSVNSLLTSRFPSDFLDQPEKRMGIPEGLPSIAEILHQRGYATVAISASPIVRKTFTKYNNHGGFDRGFDTFNEDCQWKDARCVNERWAAALAGLKEPFFAYLHYMDVHDPYRPPGWYKKRFAQSYEGLEFVKTGNPNPIADAIHRGRGLPEYQPPDLQHLIDLYDDEIAFFDGEFAVLVGDLGNRGLLDRTIVIIAADHGEQFLEHGFMKHCYTLFDTDILTPLAFRIPGVDRRQVFTPVQNVDVVPTILDYLGIEAEPFHFEGRSLRGLIEGETPGADGPAYAFAMQGARRSVADERYKLRYNAQKKEFNLHDLAVDPEERVNVLADNAEAFLRLQGALLQWETKVARGKSTQELVRVGQEVQDRLRALGYLQ